MSRRGGDSYYVLVNNNNEVYEVEDMAETYTAEFDTWEDAEDELSYLLEEGLVEEEDGWHVERHRW